MISRISELIYKRFYLSPLMSYNFILTNPSEGISNSIFVDGLKGLG
ncbi:MAG: hypothetical protein IPI04_18320 [Ignavibacteria bacterium]|nr:hypothetical protein [Ignavibacteria bacterium]